MSQHKKAIGVLGGMGPEASAYLYKTLIDLSIKEFGAEHNDEFPEIVLDSVPVPDFISSEARKQDALVMLIERVKRLNKLDLSCLSIACNTAHLLLPELQEVSSVPFVSMIDEVVAQVKKDKITKIGILGTPSTLRSKLYHAALEKEGIECVSVKESEYAMLEKAIRGVISGTAGVADSRSLAQLADGLVDHGVHGIILGCTELPLIFPLPYQKPVYNSVEILARALLTSYYLKGGEYYG